MYRKKKVGYRCLEQILALTRRNQPRAPFFSSKVEVEAGKLGSTHKSEIRPKEVGLAQAGKAERRTSESLFLTSMSRKRASNPPSKN